MTPKCMCAALLHDYETGKQHGFIVSSNLSRQRKTTHLSRKKFKYHFHFRAHSNGYIALKSHHNSTKSLYRSIWVIETLSTSWISYVNKLILYFLNNWFQETVPCVYFSSVNYVNGAHPYQVGFSLLLKIFQHEYIFVSCRKFQRE